MTAAPYRRPPDDYVPPNQCDRPDCRGWIMYGPVVGGHVWLHVSHQTELDHQVVMRPEGWWDTVTGEVRHGNGRDDLTPPADVAGLTPA